MASSQLLFTPSNHLSAAKLTANQNNAKLSSGPLDIFQTRHNALKSGIFASTKTLALQWDSMFESIVADIYNDLSPSNELESQLCTLIAADIFRMNLLMRYEFGKNLEAVNFESENLGAELDLNLNIKISKYLTGVQNRFEKLMSRYEKLKNSRC